MATRLARRGGERPVPSLRDEFESLLHEWFDQPISEVATGTWCPRADLEETDEAYLMHVELPGIAPDDIDVSFEQDTLTVKGERKFYQERSEEGFRRVERSFGSFYRAVRLPSAVDADRIEATHDNGVLTITVPKAATAKPNRIKVLPA